MKAVTLRGGPPVHPHVYSKRIRRVDAGARDGDVVALRTREGRPCGYGFFHSRSRITVRVLSHDPDVPPDESWLRERIRAADALRREVLNLPARTNAWRVVHGEGDGLSGLVVDRYADTGSVTLFSLGWQRRGDEVRRALAGEAGLERLVVRADPRAADHEGMDVVAAPSGDLVEIEEDGRRFGVDPAAGHKTGFFLDQRDNRRTIAGLVRGRAVFDGMTYTGGFAVAAACGGAARVHAVDLDEEALVLARDNAARNGADVRIEHGDVFDALRAYASASPDARPEVVIVDPPKWARDRAGLSAALNRYRDLNRLVLEAVRPGGIVLTSSCSGLVAEDLFEEVVRGAALDVRRDVRVLQRTGAAPDHPVNVRYPEGRYLKSVLAVVGGPGSGTGRGGRSRPGPARGGA